MCVHLCVLWVSSVCAHGYACAHGYVFLGGNLSVSVHEYMCVNVCVRTSVFSSSDHFWSGSSIVFQTMA